MVRTASQGQWYVLFSNLLEGTALRVLPFFTRSEKAKTIKARRPGSGVMEPNTPWEGQALIPPLGSVSLGTPQHLANRPPAARVAREPQVWFPTVFEITVHLNLLMRWSVGWVPRAPYRGQPSEAGYTSRWARFTCDPDVGTLRVKGSLSPCEELEALPPSVKLQSDSGWTGSTQCLGFLEHQPDETF